MPTMEELVGRIARTPDDLAVAVRGQTEAVLVRRPDATNWAAKEIVCHLRDTEELFLLRLEMIAAMDEPLFPASGMGARAMTLKPNGMTVGDFVTEMAWHDDNHLDQLRRALEGKV